jgi:hypothetical protein
MTCFSGDAHAATTGRRRYRQPRSRGSSIPSVGQFRRRVSPKRRSGRGHVLFSVYGSAGSPPGLPACVGSDPVSGRRVRSGFRWQGGQSAPGQCAGSGPRGVRPGFRFSGQVRFSVAGRPIRARARSVQHSGARQLTQTPNGTRNRTVRSVSGNTRGPSGTGSGSVQQLVWESAHDRGWGRRRSVRALPHTTLLVASLTPRAEAGGLLTSSTQRGK